MHRFIRLKNILLIISILCTSKLIAQNQTGKDIFIQQNFKPNKKYILEIIRSKTDSKEPQMASAGLVTTVELEVLTKEKSLFRECSWKYGATKFLGIPPESIDEKTLKMVNSYKGMDVRFLVDEKGVFQSLTNYSECKASIEKSFQLYSDLGAKPQSPEEFKKMMEALSPSYDNPEILISTYCPEIDLYFFLFGQTLNADSVYQEKTELANPFGGSTFPSVSIAKVEDVTSDIAYLSVKQIIEDEDLKRIMQETFKQFAQNSSKPFDEREIPQMNMSTSTLFTFDKKNNIMKEVLGEKFIETGDRKQIQRLKVVLKN